MAERGSVPRFVWSRGPLPGANALAVHRKAAKRVERSIAVSLAVILKPKTKISTEKDPIIDEGGSNSALPLPLRTMSTRKRKSAKGPDPMIAAK